MISQFVELPSGFMIPAVGLGTWELQGEEGLRAISTALDIGYRHIDTAEMYGNHDIVGRAIKSYDRPDLFITSKVGAAHLHYDDVVSVCDATLLELGTVYLDLFLIHWPNPAVPMQQTLDALAHLVERGKIRDMGVSNFQPHRMRQALEITPHPIANNQVELHPYLWQDELARLCRDRGVTVTAYAPLGRRHVLEDNTLRMIAEEHGVTPAQVSLRWLLQKGCIVIPRSTSEQHLRENFELWHWELSAVDMAAIDDIPERERFINKTFEDFQEG